MEKKKLICGLIVVGVFLWVTPSIGQVSVTCPGQSLQTAINSNPSGTTFNVTGTCNENIVIFEGKGGITLNGGGTAIINGTIATSATVIILEQLVTMTGLTITGGSDGIQVIRGGTATIDDNTIQSTGRAGIVVAMNGFAVIVNNTISSNPYTGIAVSENSSARIGVYTIHDTVASPNIIQSNGDCGILVSESSTALVVGNTISSNAAHGIGVGRTANADISSNTINGNTFSGIGVGYGSSVNLGSLTGTTIFDLPNSTTVDNGNSGLGCSMGATVTGRIGTLNGAYGPINSGGIGIKTSELNSDWGIDLLTASTGLIRLGNGTSNNTTKAARMVVRHYNNGEEPVYLFGSASTATDNFVAFGGGSPLGNAATQLDFFTAENATTPTGSSRITIKGTGYVGFGTTTPSYPLQMASGAHVTTGGIWTDASSREYKDNIEALATEEALDTLKELNPVKFAYKRDRTEKHVGFIAEEVPDLIATKDRKGLSPMDIVAVLTKVVQEQQKTIEEQKKEYQKTISTLREELNELKGKVR